MLNSMRTLSKSIVSKLLMLLLVISFGVWGVGDILRSNGPGYAAKVGGETISRAEFEQQRALVKGQLETLGMNDIPASKLALTVIRQLIMQKLTLMAMQDMGLVVNDALVSKMIADIPEFKNKDGKFDAKLFKRMLDNNRMSEQGFIAQLKRDIAGRFLTDSLSMHDSPAPASVIALAATIDGETRDAVLLTVPTKGAAKESDEAALKAYYDANKQFSYMLPEARTLEYVVLADTEINELVGKSITKEMVDEKLKQSPEMNEGLARMKLSAEQREDVLHTLGNTIEDELAGGKNMGEAFAKAGISVIPRVITDATPALAKSSDDDVTRTVAEQGFGLSEGEISRLISTKKGTLLNPGSTEAVRSGARRCAHAVSQTIITRCGAGEGRYRKS
ncbi:MAG: peptidylprolyl isomerase [Rickettsiales bacterium]